MDSLDFLNNNIPLMISKNNKIKKRERSCSSMEYTEYLKNWGPPAPIFK